MIWRTSRWGSALGAPYGFVVVVWIVLGADDTWDDPMDVIASFGVLGVVLGAILGFVLGAAAGSAAALARRSGASRAAATTIATLVVVIPLGLTSQGQADLLPLVVLAGALAWVTVWRVVGPDAIDEPVAVVPRWGQPE